MGASGLEGMPWSGAGAIAMCPLKPSPSFLNDVPPAGLERNAPPRGLGSRKGSQGPLTLGFMAEVRFLGAIRKAAGVATFGIDAGTVEQLLDQLRWLMGPSFQEFLFQGDTLREDLEVLVNGRNITLLDGLKTALTPFDQVTLSINSGRAIPGE